MCDCHGSPFNKLRESWSRHYKQDPQGECSCCCQSRNNKPKVKGKFGVAYVIETPTRKCRPCGWEVEFNDTPSKIENNCRMMMKWITCPPLAECQNNDTTLCCCSNEPKEAINTIQKICRKSADTQNTCCCSRERNKSSSGDCCCKKQQPSCRCDNEIVDQAECCCRKTEKQTNYCKVRKGQKEYFNSKIKCKCCVTRSDEKPTYYRSYKDEDNECRCTKTSNTQKCCCQSDSESPLEDEYCCCRTKANRKKRRRCPCSCNCRACDCSLNNTTKKHGDKEPSKNHNLPTRHDNPHKENPDSYHKPSKNFISPNPSKDKDKGQPRAPYTVSTVDVPKKGPDIAGFHAELSKRIQDMNKPQETHQETITDKKSLGESEMRSLDYDDVKVENGPNEEENYVKDDEEQVQYKTHVDEIQEKLNNLDSEKPKKKKVKAADLLRLIKEEHKKEMEAIHPKLVVKEETAPIELRNAADENQIPKVKEQTNAPEKPPRKKIKEDEEKNQVENESDTTLKAGSEQTLRAEVQ